MSLDKPSNVPPNTSDLFIWPQRLQKGKKSGHLETVIHVTHLKTPRKNSPKQKARERGKWRYLNTAHWKKGLPRAVYLNPLLSSMAESLVFFCSNLQLGEFWRMQLNSNALMSNISSLHICLELFFYWIAGVMKVFSIIITMTMAWWWTTISSVIHQLAAKISMHPDI